MRVAHTRGAPIPSGKGADYMDEKPCVKSQLLQTKDLPNTLSHHTDAPAVPSGTLSPDFDKTL